MDTLVPYAIAIFYNLVIKGFQQTFEFAYTYFEPFIACVLYGFWLMKYLPVLIALGLIYYVTTFVLPVLFHAYLAWRYLTGHIPSTVQKAYSDIKSKRSPMYGPCSSNPLTTHYFNNGVKGIVCSPTLWWAASASSEYADWSLAWIGSTIRESHTTMLKPGI